MQSPDVVKRLVAEGSEAVTLTLSAMAPYTVGSNASATVNIADPPAPPTESDIARDPSLGGLGSDNPYTRYSDQSVVVQVLAGWRYRARAFTVSTWRRCAAGSLTGTARAGSSKSQCG